MDGLWLWWNQIIKKIAKIQQISSNFKNKKYKLGLESQFLGEELQDLNLD